MKILILEDAPNRIEWFRQRFDSEKIELLITKNVEEAKRWFVEFNDDIDYLFLDNDLEDTDTTANTGETFVKWLVQMDHQNTGVLDNLCMIIIHSMNVVASENMYQDLCNTSIPPMLICRKPFTMKYDKKVGKYICSLDL